MLYKTKTLVLPVAGRSSRYPGMKPKWLLTHPKGNFMLTESVRGICIDKFDEILIIALESQEKEYGFCEMLTTELKKEYNLEEGKIKIVLLDKETRNQPETVYQGIKKAGIEGSIFIKDSDNYFLLKKIPTENFVAVIDLKNSPPLIVANKSYVDLEENDGNVIREIVEKKIISNFFCCGGYFFSNASDFIKTFEKLNEIDSLYISQLIKQMITEGYQFSSSVAENFEDWGVLEDWKKFKGNFATMFIELDGVLFLNSSRHFKPKWGETEALRRNVSAINKLYDQGRTEIILISSRKEEFREITVNQLKKNSIKYHRLLMDLPTNCKRIIIDCFSDEKSFPSAMAHNLKMNEDSLDEFLEY